MDFSFNANHYSCDFARTYSKCVEVKQEVNDQLLWAPGDVKYDEYYAPELSESGKNRTIEILYSAGRGLAGSLLVIYKLGKLIIFDLAKESFCGNWTHLRAKTFTLGREAQKTWGNFLIASRVFRKAGYYYFEQAEYCKKYYERFVKFPEKFAIDIRQKASDIRFNLGMDNRKCIKEGYGEFVAVKKVSTAISDSCDGMPTEEDYAKIYEVFEEYRQEIKDGKHEKIDKDVLQKKINEKISDIKIVFIPKSLYEVIHINAILEEEMKGENTCHLDHEKGEISRLAWRMNNVVIKLLEEKYILAASLDDGMKFEAIENLVISEIEKQKSLAKLVKKKLNVQNEDTKKISHLALSITNKNWDIARPLGIYDSKEVKETLLNMIAVECSEIGQKNLLLYRSQEEGSKVRFGGSPNTCIIDFSFNASAFSGSLNSSQQTIFSSVVCKALGQRCNDSFAEIVIQPVPLKQKNSALSHPVPNTLERFSKTYRQLWADVDVNKDSREQFNQETKNIIVV